MTPSETNDAARDLAALKRLHPDIAANLRTLPAIGDDFYELVEHASPREALVAVAVLMRALQAALGYRHILDVLDAAKLGTDDPGAPAIVSAIRDLMTAPSSARAEG
jgi:hypothetical protein